MHTGLRAINSTSIIIKCEPRPDGDDLDEPREVTPTRFKLSRVTYALCSAARDAVLDEI